MFWGIDSFGGMLAATGVSRGVLAERLRWLQSVDCLRRDPGPRGRYSLTRKSRALHGAAMMAIAWERRHHQTPDLDALVLQHATCGRVFSPVMRCTGCGGRVHARDVFLPREPQGAPEPQEPCLRRRAPRGRGAERGEGNRGSGVYRNLVELVGDLWSAKLIVSAFNGDSRFEEFQRDLPIASNTLAGRLRTLAERGIVAPRAYQQRPRRFAYHLTEKGRDLLPFFLTLRQWGEAWCAPPGEPEHHAAEAGTAAPCHTPCGAALGGEVICDQCEVALEPYTVSVRVQD